MRLFNNYYFSYLLYLLFGRKDSIMIEFYRKKGIQIGKNCNIYSNICTPEAYLIQIGNNVTIAPGCRFITHDNSVSKVIPNVTDVFGKIIIEDNVFIGANSILLPGIIIGDNSIIAAGSVVTKSVPCKVVIAGNPARIICTTDEYVAKVSSLAISTKGLNTIQKKEKILSLNRLIKK